MGAADGRRGAGVCGHHAACRHPLYGTRAQPAGSRARNRRGSFRGGESLPPRPRPSAAETSISRSTSRWRTMRRSVPTRARPDCASGDICRRASPVPSKAPSIPRGSPTSRAACWTSASTRWRSATRLARAIQGTFSRCSKRGGARLALPSRSPLPRHPRHGPRKCPCGSRLRRHDVRQFSRGPRRLSVRTRRGRKSGHRGLAVHAERSRHQTGVSIDDVAAASRAIEARLDHPLPSRFLRAPAISNSTLNS